MPNLVPPITTAQLARAYKKRIQKNVPSNVNFNPLMTVYLTDETDVDDIESGFKNGSFTAAKLYPKGATTNSDNGVTSINNIHPVLEKMQEIGMILCIHGEVTDPNVDIFNRETVFLETILDPLLIKYPNLKVVLEHITTKEAVNFVNKHASQVRATVTCHHLVANRSNMLDGGIKPDYYCLPILKSEPHRQALVEAVTSGNYLFGAGTDSAPHLSNKKYDPCGCAGCFTAPIALQRYAQVFYERRSLASFENFMYYNLTRFYGINMSKETVTLTKKKNYLPKQYGDVNVFPHGGSLQWEITK